MLKAAACLLLALVLWFQECTAYSDRMSRSTGIEVRLVNGSVPWEGRVEVRNKSVSYIWGTVCDDLWDDRDAAVVCRQLGIGNKGTAKSSAFFGTGSGSIYLDNVECNGTEETLGECKKLPWTLNNCQNTNDAGVVCQPGCDRGTFKNATSLDCIPCSFGTYQNQTNSTTCDSCSPGHYQNMTGQASCVACSPGHYQDQNGQASCAACSPGHYQDQSGQASCATCSPGHYQDQSGQASCATCSPGHYQNLTGQTSCATCSPGYYQDKSGQAFCTTCSPGHYQNMTGQASCIACSPGHYQDQRGQPSCAACSPGYYQDQSGQASCTACSPGHYQNITGKTSCVACLPGQYQFQSGQASCVACSTGHYQDQSEEASCAACSPGHYQNMTGQASGEQQLSGQSTCNKCPPGTHQENTGHPKCKPCRPGFSQNNSEQYVCSPCPAGQHQEQEGQRSCKVCPIGHFQHLTGQPSCVKCPEGTSTSSLGVDHPNNCTASPYPTSTVTVTMSYRLMVYCTDEGALKVKTAIFIRIYQLEDYIEGVCADSACSNALVNAWCTSYTSYIVETEVRFENLQVVTSLSNGTNSTTEERLVHTVKEISIFQNLGGEATLLLDSVRATVTPSCPPNFRLSETFCAYVEDDLTQMIGTAVGCSIAFVAVIFLVIILVKLNKRNISARNAEAFSKSLAPVYSRPTTEDDGYVFIGDVRTDKSDGVYDIIPASGC